MKGKNFKMIIEWEKKASCYNDMCGTYVFYLSYMYMGKCTERNCKRCTLVTAVMNEGKSPYLHWFIFLQSIYVLAVL